MALFDNKTYFVRSIKELQAWYSTEDEKLKTLVKEGKSVHSIAKDMNKKPFSVIMRMRFISGFEHRDSIWDKPDRYDDETATWKDIYSEKSLKWTSEDNTTLLNKFKNGENISNLSKYYHRSFTAILLHIQELFSSKDELEELFRYTRQFMRLKRVVKSTEDTNSFSSENDVKKDTERLEPLKLVENTKKTEVALIDQKVDEELLFNELRSARLSMSKEEGVRAYYICKDAVLHELVANKPQNIDELLCIKGFGDYKVKKYGARFLEVISKYKSISTPLIQEIEKGNKAIRIVEHPIFETFADYLFYSYANLNALSYAEKEGTIEINRTFLNIRDKSYKSYLSGEYHINDLKKENREKKKMMNRCSFCGKELDETEIVMAHVMPELKEGKDLLDNLLPACSKCNESKGNLDLFEWFFTKLHKWPDLWTTVHYMKQIYLFAEKHNLLDMNRTNLLHQELPFKLEYLPFAWPPPVVWFKDVDYEKYPYEKYVDLNW